MYKKIVVVLTAVFFIFLFSGCGIKNTLVLKEKDHIKFNYVNDNKTCIEYKGNIYYLSPIYLCDNISDEYVKLGWVGSRFWYHYFVYCDVIDDPTFLYVTDGHSCFIKETFDYNTEVFNIENTLETIVFCEDLLQCDEKAQFFGKTQCEVILSAIACPKLKINLSIFEENGKWYATSRNRVKYKLSDHFLNVLNEHEFLNIK